MNFDESGTLTVRAYTAGGALPLEGTRIKLTGALEENRFYETELITDVDGLTAKVSLPSPKRIYSLSPGAPEMPYATYDMVVSAAGYYTKKLYGIAIFSGVDSLQPVAMIPIGRGGDAPIPQDNLEIYIRENERLE
jgi:ABC-type Fe3+-hydroxamate transport system substrate-binding protein